MPSYSRMHLALSTLSVNVTYPTRVLYSVCHDRDIDFMINRSWKNEMTDL